jgi:hypothetical protein
MYPNLSSHCNQIRHSTLIFQYGYKTNKIFNIEQEKRKQEQEKTKQIQEQESTNDEFKEIDKINQKLLVGDKKKLQSNISTINNILKHNNKIDLKYCNILSSGDNICSIKSSKNSIALAFICAPPP